VPAIDIQAGSPPNVVQHGSALHVAALVSGKGGTTGSLTLGYSLEEVEKEQQQQRNLVATVSLVVFVLAALASFMIGTLLVRPLGRMTGVALRVANGDLSDPELDAGGGDEMGRMAEAFSRMLQAQREVIQQISETSVHLAGAASEMYAASQQQESAATRQS